MTLELQQEATGASSSDACALQPARPSQPRATITDLARAFERQEAQIQGMRNWMATKAAYDCSVGEALRAQLKAISFASWHGSLHNIADATLSQAAEQTMGARGATIQGR